MAQNCDLMDHVFIGTSDVCRCGAVTLEGTKSDALEAVNLEDAVSQERNTSTRPDDSRAERPRSRMPIIARDTRKEFTPAPEGLHQAVCCDVVDLGLVQTPWGEKAQVEIRWQLDIEDETNSRRYMVSKRYTLSLNEKATLRQHLEAWRGRKFTAKELEGFDLEALLGVNAQVQVVHVLTEKGNIFANIQAVVPLGRGMAKMRVSENYIRVIDRTKTNGSGGSDDSDHDDAVPF